MKKMLFGLLFIAGGAYASCVGPFCWDQSGASVGGLGVDGNGFATPSASSTTINSTTPKYVGQEILCTTCVNAGTGNYGICIDTAANAGAWVMISSTTQRCQ